MLSFLLLIVILLLIRYSMGNYVKFDFGILIILN